MTTSIENTTYLMRLCEEVSFAYMFPSLFKMEETAACLPVSPFHKCSRELSLYGVEERAGLNKTKLGKQACFPYG